MAPVRQHQPDHKHWRKGLLPGQCVVPEWLCPTASEDKAVRSVGELDQAFSLPFILQSLRTISREFLGFVEGVFTSTLAVAQFQLARYMSSVGCVSQELNKNLRKICGSL